MAVPPSPTPKPRVPVETPFIGQDIRGGVTGISWPWLNWFQKVAQYLAGPPNIPGPYASDAAAAAAGVPKKAAYYQASGAVVVRLV